MPRQATPLSAASVAGAALDTLCVTSARARLDPGSLAAAPLSGALFAVATKFRGAPIGLFGG